MKNSLTSVLQLSYILLNVLIVRCFRLIHELVFFAPPIDDIQVGLVFEGRFQTADKCVKRILRPVFLGPQGRADGFLAENVPRGIGKQVHQLLLHRCKVYLLGYLWGRQDDGGFHGAIHRSRFPGHAPKHKEAKEKACERKPLVGMGDDGADRRVGESFQGDDGFVMFRRGSP